MGDARTGEILKLTPQSVITGRVLDEDGDPLPAAYVQIFTPQYENGYRTLRSLDATNVDDTGRYRLSRIAPGHYYLRASALNRTISTRSWTRAAKTPASLA